MGVEAGCLEDGLEFEELDQLVHAGSAVAFADALTDFGEECRWVDGAVGSSNTFVTPLLFPTRRFQP